MGAKKIKRLSIESDRLKEGLSEEEEEESFKLEMSEILCSPEQMVVQEE